MKKIYAVCGSGVATSTMIASKVRDYLEERGVQCDVQTTTYGIVNGGGLVADCLVSTNPNITCGDIPVVPGVALLTGMGEEAVLEQVYQIVKE